MAWHGQAMARRDTPAQRSTALLSLHIEEEQRGGVVASVDRALKSHDLPLMSGEAVVAPARAVHESECRVENIQAICDAPPFLLSKLKTGLNSRSKYSQEIWNKLGTPLARLINAPHRCIHRCNRLMEMKPLR